MDILRDSKEHLEDSQKTYRQHLYGALYYGVKLFIGAIASVIHGLFPFLLRGTAAIIIIDTFYDELYNHKNKEYQAYMKAKRESK
jgi:hypothetical protein